MNYITLITTLFLITCGPCSGQNGPAVYNDLVSFGYKGNVDVTTSAVYKAFRKKNGQWEADDVAQPTYRLTTYYNEQGNIAKRIYSIGEKSSETVYAYFGGKRTWKKKGKGIMNETGEVMLKDSLLTETIYDTKGRLRSKKITTLNQHKRISTATLWEYDDTGRVKKRSFITQYRDSSGLLNRMIIENRMPYQSEILDYITLEYDKNKNPIKTLQKLNGKPELLFITRITYRK